MSIAYAANIGRCIAFFIAYCIAFAANIGMWSTHDIQSDQHIDSVTKYVCHNRSSEDGATLKAAFPRRHWCCHRIPPKPGCTWNPQQGSPPSLQFIVDDQNPFLLFFRTLVPSRDWRSPRGWRLQSQSCFSTSSLHGSGFKSFRFFSFLMTLVQILNSF